MVALNDLARQYVDLDSAGRVHLRRLVGSWAPLSDLSFSDLLLWAPVKDREGALVVLGQIRPSTAQTVHIDDRVGRVVEGADQPLVAKALATGETYRDETEQPLMGEIVCIDAQATPVRHDGRLVAVVTSERRVREPRDQSRLESVYRAVFERLAVMISDGTFPFPFEDAVTEESPRVGDGALLIDGVGRVVFSSPNAVSALHRLGYHGRITDSQLGEMGFDPDLVDSAFRLKVPVLEELERGDRATILCRILPLIEKGQVTGGLVLLRDVSDLRRRDRMLVSMNATIREIHHRVKNNLQTVSSLLRLQGRRLESPEAKAAIEESVRRIASIAVVHEMLATSGGDEVEFRDVLQPIVNLTATDLVDSARPIRFRLIGDGPTMSASKASSLAVVVTELLQNAVEHGYPPGSEGGVVTIELLTSRSELQVRVHDDGVGVDPGFDPSQSTGLGLTIISSLASGELGGQLKIRPARPPRTGTMAQVTVRLDETTDD